MSLSKHKAAPTTAGLFINGSRFFHVSKVTKPVLVPGPLRWFHSIALSILSAKFFAWLGRACSELGRFSMKTELSTEMSCRFLQNKIIDPTFLFHYLKKIWLCMIYPNLKNFWFKMFHWKSANARFAYYFIPLIFTGNFNSYCNIVLLSQE